MTDDLRPYPAYKDSGAPWLGEVPEHWDVRRLKSLLAQPVTDGPHLTPEFLSSGVPFLSVDGIQRGELVFDPCRYVSAEDHVEFSKKAAPRRDDILLGKAASTGKIARIKVDFPFSIWSPLALIRVDEGKAKPAFIEYTLKDVGAQAQVETLCTFNTQKNISMDDIPKLILPLPPLDEQSTIARFLDHTDRRIRRYIRAKQKLIKLLEEQKQAIVHRAITQGLDSSVPMNASGLEWMGEVPEHWERRRLKTLLRPVDRRSVTGTETLLSLRRDHGVVIYSEHFTRPPQGRSLVGFKLVAVGQLVVNRLQANNGLVFCSGVNGLVSPDYSVFEMTEPFQMQYLSDLLRTSTYRAHFRRESTGLGTGSAGFLRLYDDKLLETPVYLPPEEEQVVILDSLASDTADLTRLIQREQKQLELVGELQSRLVSDVVTGKLDVREAAAGLPDEPDEPEPLDELEDADTEEEEDLDADLGTRDAEA